MAQKAAAKPPGNRRAASTQAPLLNLENSADHRATTLAHRAPPTGEGLQGEGPLLPQAGPRSAAAATLAPPTRQALNIRRAAKAVYWTYRGANVTDALKAAGIPERTWRDWSQAVQTGRYPNGFPVAPEQQAFAARLAEAFGRAQGLFALKMQRTLAEASRMKVGERDWRAAHEHLKHAEATRKRWHEHRELKIEQVGQISHEHRLVREMDDQQLLEGLDADWIRLLPPPAAD